MPMNMIKAVLKYKNTFPAPFRFFIRRRRTDTTWFGSVLTPG